MFKLSNGVGKHIHWSIFGVIQSNLGLATSPSFLSSSQSQMEINCFATYQIPCGERISKHQLQEWGN